VTHYCAYCGLLDGEFCQSVEQSDNCPHAPDYITEDELHEIEELI
jgi:hypothetical protein